jgi:hypothetical protein
MRKFIECQIAEDAEGFTLTVTITAPSGAADFYWTSKPARLRARNGDDANAEAFQQIKALRMVLDVQPIPD